MPDVEMLVTGVGVVEASCSVTQRLMERRYSLVIDAGIAGAFEQHAQVGDGVVVADDSFALRRENGEAIVLPDGEPIFQRASSDAALVHGMVSSGVRACSGITVSRVTTSATSAAVASASGAQVETMEGFAVLRAAQLLNVPAIQLRGISNIVGEPASWDIEAGLRGLRGVVQTFFTRVWPMPRSLA